MKNSTKNKLLRLITESPSEWKSASVFENTSTSGLSSLERDSMPLNPLAHPKNELVVMPVYVMISLLILNRP